MELNFMVTVKKRHLLLISLLVIFFVGTICAATPAHAKVLGKTKVNGKVIKITDNDCQKIAEGKDVCKSAGYLKYKVVVKKKKGKKVKRIKKIKKAKVRVSISKYAEDGTRAPSGYLYAESWTSYHGPLKVRLVYINYGYYFGF